MHPLSPCVSAVLMIATGAFGALTVGNVKWVWWFFGMCWFLHIIFALGKSWAEAAKAKGGESGSVYSKIAGITVITWFCYPIVWVFAEGFGNFSVTFEVCLPRLWLRTVSRFMRGPFARFFVGASAGGNGPHPALRRRLEWEDRYLISILVGDEDGGKKWHRRCGADVAAIDVPAISLHHARRIFSLLHTYSGRWGMCLLHTLFWLFRSVSLFL